MYFVLWVIIYQWHSVTVCRWVKWLKKDKFWLNSPTSRRLITCRQTVKVTCWSLTASVTAFYCWTVNYNYNASSSTTQTPKLSCGGQHEFTTTNYLLDSMCTTPTRDYSPISSRYSIYIKWLTHQCSTPTTRGSVPVCSIHLSPVFTTRVDGPSWRVT